MGKKRIKVFGDEEEVPQKKKKEERKIVKTGKEHGRITDMGAVALAEAETLKEKEAELEKLVSTKAKEEKKEPKKPARKRGQRYLKAKKQIDRTKFYPLEEAIKLLKKTSTSRFKAKVELHLNVKEKGLKKTVILPHPLDKQTSLKVATEKKAPLIHLVIAKLEAKEAEIAANFQAIIQAIGKSNIRKAVLAATMGPGIKVKLD